MDLSKLTKDDSPPSDEPTGHAFRDALRLLFILVRGSAPHPSPTEQWNRVFLGEKRALAIDFWLRYPDYLADQLLNLHEAGGGQDLFDAAKRILAEEEPDVRLVKMIRWQRGAFDDLQTSLAILGFRGLTKPMRRKQANGHIYEYLTGPLARTFLEEAVKDQPELEWYERQTSLALRLATDKSGSALKDIHYAEEEYAKTPYGEPIPSITDRVIKRIKTIEGADA